MLACRPGLGEFFLKAELASEVIEIDKKTRAGRQASMRQLTAREWDWIFVPHESVRTALWLTRMRARGGKVGFAKWWNHLVFSHRVVKPVSYPDALRQLSLLTPLDEHLAESFGTPEIQAFDGPDLGAARVTNPGASNGRVIATDLRLPRIPNWASMQVQPHQPRGRRIFLAPGSVWNTKRWIASGYLEIAREMLARGFHVDLVGSSAERDLCEDIVAQAPGARNLAGTTSLSGLADLLSEGTALVCNDSGAMHVAASVGLPTLAIFGPTVLSQGFRPWQNQALVLERDLTCRPCGKHGSQACPIGTHECMTTISAAEILRYLIPFAELAR